MRFMLISSSNNTFKDEGDKFDSYVDRLFDEGYAIIKIDGNTFIDVKDFISLKHIAYTLEEFSIIIHFSTKGDYDCLEIYDCCRE